MTDRPTNCPNCGAVLSNGHCEYCGSTVYLDLPHGAKVKPRRHIKINFEDSAEQTKRERKALEQAMYGVRDTFGTIWYYRDETGRRLTADEILDKLDKGEI